MKFLVGFVCGAAAILALALCQIAGDSDEDLQP